MQGKKSIDSLIQAHLRCQARGDESDLLSSTLPNLIEPGFRDASVFYEGARLTRDVIRVSLEDFAKRLGDIYAARPDSREGPQDLSVSLGLVFRPKDAVKL
eukprot:m51a1_g793 hypothetical protein (101) ;mRNA; r:639014-639385